MRRGIRRAALPAALSVVLTAAACGGGAGGPRRDEGAAEGRGGCDRGIAEGVDAWSDAGFSGSVAVVDGGEVACAAAAGAADPATGRANAADTVFSIGSVSKAFTAAAVLDLVDEGRLSLTDRVGDVVPGLGGPVAGVTVEHVLLHTSGLVGDHGHDHVPLARDEAVAALGGLELAGEPGAAFRYSNAGYTLLALIVEEASGRPYREHLAGEILRLPGGGAAGGFWDGNPAAPGPRAVGDPGDGTTGEPGDFPGPHWALTGNGDLAMTMRDLASWTHALFTGRVVSPEAVERLLGLRFDHGDGTAELPGWVAIDAPGFGEPVVAAEGGGGDVGHEAVVAWLPESGRALAIASNSQDVPAGDLLRTVGPALAAGEPWPAPDAVADVDPADAAAVAGTYELGGGDTLAVTGRAGRLVIAATGADAAAALRPRPEGVAAGEVAAHEAAVQALLAGGTPAGRDERAALAAETGPIDRIDPAGTVVENGELRSYVQARGADRSALAWYALDGDGNVAAAEIDVAPPALVLGAAGDGRYRPDDPLGDGADVTVTFAAGRLTISGPDGTTTARSAG
jgi:CubicO group peptidase (beta-lactamase class C family)